MKLSKNAILTALYGIAHAVSGNDTLFASRKDAVDLLATSKKNGSHIEVGNFFFMKGLVNQSFTRSTRISRNTRKALQHG